MIVVSTPTELLRVAIAEIAGDVSYKDVQISDNLVMTIKIDGEEWQDAKYFDYKSALIVEAIQRDFLGIYNGVTGSRIALSDLDNYPDLIVKIQIEDGCIKYIVRGIKYILEYSKGMNPEQKLLLTKLIFGTVACSSIAWASSHLSSAWKDVAIANYQSVPAIIDSINKSERILSDNRRTQKIIIEHSGDNTKVSIGDDKPISVGDLRQYVEDAPKAEVPESFYVDGNYPVRKYDFDGQKASIRMGKKDEWVSTEFLEHHDRAKIKELAGKAIDEGKGQRADLQVSIMVLNGEVVGAAIMGIGSPRANSKTLYEALMTKQQRQRMKQAPLMPHAGKTE